MKAQRAFLQHWHRMITLQRVTVDDRHLTRFELANAYNVFATHNVTL